MASNSLLHGLDERGWTCGLSNLLDNELALWWKTKRWWTQTLIWVALSGFFLAAFIFGSPDFNFNTAVVMYGLFGGIPPVIGITIVMQDALVGEKKDGTAAWVLSKPVARPAFIFSKLAANGFGGLITMILFPGLVAYGLLSFGMKAWLDPLHFLAALGVMFLNLLFFLTLTLMLGSMYNSRGPVIGIPLAIAFLQQFLIGMLPPLRYLLPWTLIVPVGNVSEAIAPSLILGQPADSYVVILGVAIECVLFTLISLRRFEQEEF
jgi:ABC-2 type transport system permease protein